MNENNTLEIKDNDNILFDLIHKQRKVISIEKKLLFNDLKRISKYLNKTIFDDECSLWTGYVTIIKGDEKNFYINFYFKGKKYALHRLLYINYICELEDSEYIKFSCHNKGKCCNINHIYKIDETQKKKKKESVCSDSEKVSDIEVSKNEEIEEAVKKTGKIIVGFR